MRKGLLILIVIACLTLASCYQQDTNSEPVLINHSALGSKVSMQTPLSMRSIALDNLSLELEINGSVQTHLGANFPDGNWNIDFILQTNQEHSIEVRWFANNHLLLEETGTFFTDSASSTIAPTLEFSSAGEPRFDTDCDGLSNLEELRNSTDPSIAQGNLPSNCELPSASDDTPQSPSLTRQHLNFDDFSASNPIASVSQHINIKRVPAAVLSGAGPVMQLNVGENGRRNSMRLELFHHPELGRSVRFIVLDGLSATESDAENLVCRAREPDAIGFAGYTCTMPFDWQENHWYELRFEEVSQASWQGIITDLEADVVTVIGTIEIDDTVGWFRPQFNIRDVVTKTLSDCANGIDTFRVHYRLPLVNNTVRWETSHVTANDCLKAGAGWKEGMRTVDGELLFSATIGGD